METINGVQWKLEDIDFVDVDGRRIWPWPNDAATSSARSSTSLTPPVVGGGGPSIMNTIEAEAPNPVDIHRMLDDMLAFRATEEVARQRYVDAAMELVVGLSKRGQDEQAWAILRSLTRPKPFWATRFEPTDRRPS